MRHTLALVGALCLAALLAGCRGKGSGGEIVVDGGCTSDAECAAALGPGHHCDGGTCATCDEDAACGDACADCGRNQFQRGVDSFIDHGSASALGAFVADFYSVRPADFAVMDGLQALQNGPCSTSPTDRMNMRLVLASRNAVALDAVAARVMGCDPARVPALTGAVAYGLGTIESSQIRVVGNRQVADVQRSFASGVAGVCR